MEPESARQGVLTSWKEIAAYLGVTPRTAQAWERERSLPVKRLPGGRGIVSANIADIEAWRNSRPVETANPNLPIQPRIQRDPRWFRSTRRLALIGGVLFCAGAVAFWPRVRNPVSLRVDGTTLVAMDARARECWRLTLPSLIEAPGVEPWIGDLDDDGHHEVLYPYYSHAGSDKILICIDRNGKERWRFVPGPGVRAAGQGFAPPFVVQGILVERFADGAPLKIVVASNHSLHYPSQIALIDREGRLEREYWHSGHLAELATTMVDGKRLIVAGGVNNSRNQAALVLLDPDEFGGASQEPDPKHQIQGKPAGRERARVFFPPSCISERFEPFATVGRILMRSGYLVAEVQHHNAGPSATLFYELNPDLTFREMVAGSDFELTHRTLHAEGKLDHALSDSEIAALSKIVREP